MNELFRVYGKALGILRSEAWLTLFLVIANIVLGILQLAEPILFGRVVDALAGGRQSFPLIGLWAILGFFGMIASVVLAVWADRLAHRQRLTTLGAAFERAITLPISYHAERGTGRIVRIMLAGADTLFSLWLSFMREHLASAISIVLLVPTALSIDVRLAGILFALACIYTIVNVLVVRRTHTGQSAVERYHQDVFGRVGDVIGNVTIVQSYSRLRDEQAALGEMIRQLLAAQYPVLTWWGLLTVITRASATLSMVAIFAIGALLAQSGEVSVGEIVSFVAFASLLIGKLDSMSSFVSRLFSQVPTLNAFFDLLETSTSIVEKPGAQPLRDVAGAVGYSGVTYPVLDRKSVV